jgi:hypothetical protein
LGEIVIEAQSGKLQSIAYIEFVRRSPNPENARWIEPLRTILVRAWHTVTASAFSSTERCFTL